MFFNLILKKKFYNQINVVFLIAGICFDNLKIKALPPIAGVDWCHVGCYMMVIDLTPAQTWHLFTWEEIIHFHKKTPTIVGNNIDVKM